jgi:hypothetical protein
MCGTKLARGAAVLVAVMVAGCSPAGKTAVDEDLGDLGGAGGKADGIDSMVVATLDYGQVSAPLAYHNPPRYRLVKFAADEGDVVSVTVSSATGDAMVWLLDDDLTTLASNDDADASTLDAHVELTIPANPSRTHYVVFRDYWLEDASFVVSLDGTPAAPIGCQVDADCAMVEAGCCHVGDWTAIPTDEVADFEAAKQCDPNPNCPLSPIEYRGEQAQCNTDTHACEITLPEDVACGGRTLNPHSCPDGWQCMGQNLAVDIPGECVQMCGGFGNRPCSGGLSCVDDPSDDCDPQGGGADCGGICVDGAEAGCDLVGCDEDGASCQMCFGSWQCMPAGAQC